MKGQPGAGGTVVMFSTADWAAPCWTNKQHIARRLAERGYTVLYIETVGLRRPSINSLDLTRIIRRLRSGLKPPRRVGERLWVLSPLTLPLGQRHGFVRHFNAWILRTAIRLWLRRHGDGTPPLVWTYHPYMLEAISGLKRSALVYHCVDNIAAVPMPCLPQPPPYRRIVHGLPRTPRITSPMWLIWRILRRRGMRGPCHLNWRLLPGHVWALLAR